MKQTSITAIVPQGIGDILWIYQRLAPLFDQLHFRIATIAGQDGDKAVQRAKPFVEGWPQVASVKFHTVTSQQYDHLANTRFYLPPSWQGIPPETPQHFACNATLEAGVRLDAFSPEFPTRWDIEFPIAEQSDSLTIQDCIDNGEPYLALYISGHSDFPHPKQLGAWSTDQWITFYRTLCDLVPAIADMPVALVGASYDHRVMRRFVEEGKLLRSTWVIGQPAPQVYHCLKHAYAFAGYQSGIGVLADALETPSLMLYFNSLDGLHYSWCKPGHREHGIFTAQAFRQDPQIAANLWAQNLNSLPKRAANPQTVNA